MKPIYCLWLLGCFFILGLAGGCSSGGDKEIPTPPQTPVEKDVINVSKDSLQTACSGGEELISFTTNQNWTASSSQTWCTLSETSGVKGSVSLKVTIAENTTFENRVAVIQLKAGTATGKMVITQTGAERDKLELATTTFSVAAEGKEIQIPFQTDVPWEVSSDQDWCTLSATSGEAGTQSITATIARNKVKAERMATLTFKAGTATPQKVTITQAAAPPDQIEVEKTVYEVQSNGEDVKITFTANTSWMISSDQDWCTLSTAVGEEGTHTVTAKVNKNTTYEDRKTTITLKAGTAQEIVTLTQEKCYALKVNPKEAVVDYAGSKVEVKVESNTKYEISFSATWLRLVTSRSLKEETLVFEVDMNEAETVREAEITFFNQEKNLKATFKIKQEGKPEDTSVTPNGNIGNMTWG